MGSYCSVHNDTPDETVMVYIGVNTKVLSPVLWTISGLATVASSSASLGLIPAAITAAEGSIIVSVGAVAATAGGAVSFTNWAMDKIQNQLVADFSKGGYKKLLPGQTYTSSKNMVGLNMRAWVVRIQKFPDAIVLKRASASVWTGPTNESNITYNVLDRRYFKHWRNETIPVTTECVKEVTPVTAPCTNNDKEGYCVVEPRIEYRFEEDKEEEDETSSWVRVDAEKTNVC